MKLAIRVGEAFRVDISYFNASFALIRQNRSISEFSDDGFVWENAINHVRVFCCQPFLNGFFDDRVVG